MSDYTPTTEEVREEYVSQGWGPDGSLYVENDPAAFDRWLTAHNRKIAARAWEEGWDACVEYMNGPDWGQSLPNPYLERSNND